MVNYLAMRMPTLALLLVSLLATACGVRRGLGEASFIEYELRRDAEHLRMRPKRGTYGPYEGTKPVFRVLEDTRAPKVDGDRVHERVTFELRTPDAGKWSVTCDAHRAYDNTRPNLQIGPIDTRPLTRSSVLCRAEGRGIWTLELAGSVENGLSGHVTGPGDPEQGPPGRRATRKAMLRWSLYDTPVVVVHHGGRAVAAISHARPFRVLLHPSLGPTERAALTTLMFPVGWFRRGE